MLRRLQGAWRELDAHQRLAAFAALGLLATLFLPWYDHTFVDTKTRAFVSENVNAFGKVSFIEAAIFLVAAGVLALLFARGERRGFHLPGGDGTVIFAAGLWAALLLLWRVFDRPDAGAPGERYGITWGFFFAFLAAAGLAVAGWRLRAAHIPEPPLPVEQEEPPAGAETAVTRVAPRARRPAGPPGGQLSLDDAEPEPARRGDAPRAEG